MVNGIPTITKIVLNNVNAGSRSEIDVTKVIYDKHVPADLFDPKRLPEKLRIIRSGQPSRSQ